MTVFAGVISLSNEPPSSQLLTDVRKQFAVLCNQKATFEQQKSNTLILQCDVQAYDNVTTLQSELHTTVIAGEPLLRNSYRTSLHDDVTQLHQAGADNNLSKILKTARGVFSGIHVDEAANRIQLFSDKLGIRPVFYYQKDNIIVFSSLFSLFKYLPQLDLKTDFTGLCEYLAFNYCLSDRTQYQFIKRIDVGQILNIEKGTVKISQYWNWADIQAKSEAIAIDIEQLYKSFEDAIKLRLNDSNEAIAFLSGGLDSRVIAASLKQHVKTLHTFNFSTHQSQDREYARVFAKSAQIDHHEKVFESLSFPNWTQLIADATDECAATGKIKSNQRLVWSGDGGSVALGYVYIEDVMLDALDKDNNKYAIDLFMALAQTFVPKSFFKSKYVQLSKGVIEASILDELPELHFGKTRSMYYFLMNNDQKRHLSLHFETICQHKTELHLPFFDSDFLQNIYGFPAKEMMYHKLYMQWFEYFPKCARQTPWQTYPKHVPCPIKNTSSLSYQWDKSTTNHQNRKQDFSEYLALRKNRYIQEFFNSQKLMIAMVLHRIGVKDYSYLIDKLKRLKVLVHN
ncbi:asparagine synthase-related protein [Paraglaciecola arctica]|uniref:asparagine synthase-related protein n=1 Tax=Paraglaciecola arctica TaxID=1128911 RepID=UPI0002FCCA3D|nr:asparagine synthetase B family protein [Paraglaciecola arctica]